MKKVTIAFLTTWILMTYVIEWDLYYIFIQNMIALRRIFWVYLTTKKVHFVKIVLRTLLDLVFIYQIKLMFVGFKNMMDHTPSYIEPETKPDWYDRLVKKLFH